MTREEMVVTDVQPRFILCPLPKGYWWQARFLMRLNSCHMDIIKRRRHWMGINSSVGDTVVVLDLADKGPGQIVQELIEGSYEVWQDYFRKVGSREQQWIAKANEVGTALQTNSRTPVVVKVERS